MWILLAIKDNNCISAATFCYKSFLLILLLVYPSVVTCLNSAKTFQCQSSSGGSSQDIRLLGLPDSEQRIRNEDFTASSSYHSSFLPKYARISSGPDDEKRAWCPKKSISTREISEWIEVKMDRIYYSTLFLTQPRVHDYRVSQTGEFTKELQIWYKRDVGEEWKTYQLFKTVNGIVNKTSIIKGNTDLSDMRNFVQLSPPIIARYIRIYPYNSGSVPVSVCLKFDFFGCESWQGIVSYSMPQGHILGKSENYTDIYYDGTSYSDDGVTLLKNGVGQLTDGMRTLSSPLTDPGSFGIAGFAYVGWKLSLLRRPFVDITFTFDVVRRFESVVIDIANDQSELQARFFRKANVSFSIGGKFFNDYVIKDLKPDPVYSMSRPISIDLLGKVGRFVSLRLFLDPAGKWMFISEIYFNSTVVQNPPSPEKGPSPGILPPKKIDGDSGSKTEEGTGNTGEEENKGTSVGGGSVHPPDNGIKEPVDARPPFGPEPRARDNETTYIIIIVSCLFVAMLLMSVIGFLCLRRRRLRKKQRCLAVQAHKHDGTVHLDFTNGHPTLSINGKAVINGSVYTSLPNSDDEGSSHGGMPNTSMHYTFVPNPRTPQPIAREYASTTIYAAKQCNAGSSPPPPYGNHNDLYTIGLGTYARPKIISNPIADLSDRGLNAAGNKSTLLNRHPHTMTIGAVPNPPMYIPGPGGLIYPAHLPTVPPPVPRFPSDLSIQGGSGNNVYACPADFKSQFLLDDVAPLEVDKKSLNMKDRLGGGQFGEVRLAEWQTSPDEPEMLVAVKMLRPDASSQARVDFKQEMRILARLQDPNIVRVLGVVSKDTSGPLCILVEYMPYGDLHQFLRYRVPADVCNNLPHSQPTLSYGCLIFLAAQIASGMKYLESLQLVHRDLACRNCLVGKRFEVKISDFGMSRSLYSADYYRIEGRAVLPIRWMAWEAVLLGKFTTGSDVWSFAVTLWEILNFCRQQPFSHLSDEEVIRFCGEIYLSNEKPKNSALSEPGTQGQETRIQLLPCPPMCPREIYDLMCECWNREVTHRPSFREIHMFLLRKNMGYAPSDDSLLSIDQSDSLSSLSGPT